MLRLFRRQSTVQAMVARLEQHSFDARVQQELASFLMQAQDRELYHCNPRYLGERLGIEERPLLRLLLAALYEGLISLHWDVRCSICGGIDHRHTELGHLHHDMQCPMCHSRISPHLDQEVFITFSPHERVRSLPASADDLAFRQEIEGRLGTVPGLSMLLLPDFQRLFPQQRLLPDESLDVSRIALIFTDLAGSTALYARRGDPRAYHLVRLHFDTLFTVVNACGGTVVKTIGDAVMAVFQTPAEAMEAAIMMQHAIAELNNERQLSDDERLILKVGVHSGPTLSVTLNDRPDYFGTTVNLAARAQGLSQGRDVVFTEALYHDSEIASNLADWPVISNRAMLKGIENETTIFRLLLDGTAPLPSNHAPALQSEA